MEAILFVVAHPDDVADGMGGTAHILKDKYMLYVLCATRGEKGCRQWTPEHTAKIREEEERQACELMDARLSFLDGIDGNLFADAETCRSIAGFITELEPVALFTLWPMDRHPDHSAISEAARRAVSIADVPIDIAYCEEGDGQTYHFVPDVYVDISGVIENKLEMIRCHQSQNGGDGMARHFLKKSIRRGAECGVAHAEGFRVHSYKNAGSTFFLRRTSVPASPETPARRISSSQKTDPNTRERTRDTS
jgi:LmbE family N-acetylglucosaminyl deacetylase